MVLNNYIKEKEKNDNMNTQRDFEKDFTSSSRCNISSSSNIEDVANRSSQQLSTQSSSSTALLRKQTDSEVYTSILNEYMTAAKMSHSVTTKLKDKRSVPEENKEVFKNALAVELAVMEKKCLKGIVSEVESDMCYYFYRILQYECVYESMTV